MIALLTHDDRCEFLAIANGQAIQPADRAFSWNVAEVSQESVHQFANVKSLPTDGRRPGPGGTHE
jgi:hypothetical protein